MLQRKGLCHHHARVYTHTMKGTHNPFCLQQLMPSQLSPAVMLGMDQNDGEPPRSNTTVYTPAPCLEIRLGLGTSNANNPVVLTHQPSTGLQLRGGTNLSLEQPDNTRIMFPDLTVNVCFSKLTEGVKKPTRDACRGRIPLLCPATEPPPIQDLPEHQLLARTSCRLRYYRQTLAAFDKQ